MELLLRLRKLLFYHRWICSFDECFHKNDCWEAIHSNIKVFKLLKGHEVVVINDFILFQSKKLALIDYLGAGAIDALLEGRKREMIGLVNKELVFMPFEKVVKHHKELNKQLLSLAEILAL